MFMKTLVVSPIAGEVVRLEAVDDLVFSQKMLGDGVGIKPMGDTVFAPVSGKIKMLFNTKHAIGIETESGAEVMIHVGIDTVNLQGKPFVALKNVNDEVKQGEALLKVDFPSIIQAGYDPITLIISLNRSIQAIDVKGKIEIGSPVFEIVETE